MSKELITQARLLARMSDLPTKQAFERLSDRIKELEREVESLKASMYRHYELEAERDALLAHVERLRDAMVLVKFAVMALDGTSVENEVAHYFFMEALVATPAQSLARHDNEIIEKCAAIAERLGEVGVAAVIYATKEPE